MLREPVDRWFSHFFYDRYKESSHRRIETDLEEFLESEEASEMGRVLTFHLAGGQRGASLELAKQQLDRITLVGFLDALPQFEADFQAIFGHVVRIPHANGNPAPEALRRAQASGELRRRVTSLCEPDLALYDYARTRRRTTGEPFR